MRTHMSSYYCIYIYVYTVLHTSKRTFTTTAPGVPSASYSAIAYYYILLYIVYYYILLYMCPHTTVYTIYTYIRVGGRLWHAQL
jgi:hypothetical protein